MARVTIEDCLDNVENRFALVMLAAKRSRQLAAGHAPMVDAENKDNVMALREIAAGKVGFEAEISQILADWEKANS